MVKTYGSRDRKPRKKRKLYAGKPIKKKRHVNGKLVPYKSIRSKYDPISVWFFRKDPMSYEGYLRWSRNLRPHTRRIVFRNVDSPVLVSPSLISTPEKVEEFAIEIIGYPGVFQLRMPTHKKNKNHVSYCKKADIKITETTDGLKAKTSNYSKLKRYWFFRG